LDHRLARLGDNDLLVGSGALDELGQVRLGIVDVELGGHREDKNG
jgi:hypothetical protein